MNIVVSEPKTGKAFSFKSEKPLFTGKKVGDKVDLSEIGLEGYEGKIAGGSDKNGFPMKPSLPGMARKKIFISSGVGFKPKRDGIRVRKTVRGNIVAEDVHQLNVAVTKAGSKPFESFLKKEEKKEEGAGEAGGKAPKAEEKPAEAKEAKPAAIKEEKPAEKAEEKKETVKPEEKKEEKAEEKKEDAKEAEAK